MPWLGYFDQMQRVDAFLIADELPYSSSGWTHRNRVKGPDGVPHWLTLPSRPKHKQPIHEVVLDDGIPWARKHMRTLRHFYSTAPAARELLDDLEQTLQPAARLLPEASIPTIRWMAKLLGIETPLLISSELGLERHYVERFPDQSSPTHRIIAYLESLGATELLEAEAGLNYFDVELFDRHGMRVEFHLYNHPSYPQLHGPFVSHLSAIDLLLSVGPQQARHVLRSGTLRRPHG